MNVKKALSKNIITRKTYSIASNVYPILLCKLSPVAASKRLYKKAYGRKPNLKNPTSFNEKLMIIKIKNYNKNKLVYNCSDKIKVREYAMSKGVDKDNLPELIKIYKNENEIQLEELPEKFAIKCSHGCGYNIICNNKNNFDIEEAKNKLKKWKKIKFGYATAEPHYTHIKPTIYCEKYIDNKGKKLPTDYKIYCFNGIPKLVLVCSEREVKTRLNFYDLKWNKLEIGKKEYENSKVIKKPEHFDEMLEISKKISKPFPYVRCDFYEYNGKAILGEMTFTPAACIGQYYTKEGEEYLGKLLKI